MAQNVQKNIKALQESLLQLKNHPMAQKIKEDNYKRLIVIMPECVDGIDGFRIEKTTKAIQSLLKRLDSCWDKAYHFGSW